MRKKKGRTYKTTEPKKESNVIGTLSGIEGFMRREGRVNSQMNPEISGKIHGSKKDYNRKREKERVKGWDEGVSSFFYAKKRSEWFSRSDLFVLFFQHV